MLGNDLSQNELEYLEKRLEGYNKAYLDMLRATSDDYCGTVEDEYTICAAYNQEKNELYRLMCVGLSALNQQAKMGENIQIGY